MAVASNVYQDADERLSGTGDVSKKKEDLHRRTGWQVDRSAGQDQVRSRPLCNLGNNDEVIAEI